MGSLSSFGSKPKKQAPPPVIKAPPAPAEAPTPADADVIDAGKKRRRRAGSAGYQGTVLTGELSQATTGKTILGN